MACRMAACATKVAAYGFARCALLIVQRWQRGGIALRRLPAEASEARMRKALVTAGFGPLPRCGCFAGSFSVAALAKVMVYEKAEAT
ncbi:hypothetical protein NPIL_372101 [Nephila pilipes]|uniref:Uncharacterized protein n=1 Tax=Nephila pilipes TaxID=299642 RepID=A0A8X6N3Z8_NEPPI|nr:hypothetical protein NPIL_372101 [Nephila pilipes]